MKKRFPFALLAAGVIAACQVTINHPAHALEASASKYDTAFYFNESGNLIYCDTLATGRTYYVIKTCRIKEQLYYDWFERNPATRKGNFESADVRNISVKKAMEVEQLICKGKVTDTAVINNVVEVYSPAFIKKLYDTIPDSGKSIDRKKDFREYGGMVLDDGSFTFQRGKKANPCDTTAAIIIQLHLKGKAYYHSHPSGEKNNGECAFIQAASRTDQDAVGGLIGYVFGMNKRSHRLYVVDKNGIQATLPFCWFLCESVNK